LTDYRPEQVRVQQIIHSSAERMVEILDNAIRITARKRDQILPKFEEVDVVKLIEEAVRETASLAELHELRLTSEIKGELPRLISDARHLRQILDNLLSNACRFTPPGGKVTVRAWLAEPKVYITEAGQLAQPELMLSVADTGIGIPQTELKRVFEPFYQLKQPEVQEVTGMGMGLAVVKELVELHQGRVWVESMPGEGSVFQVAVPLTQT
jgi:signal transduction histidine kinase